MSGVGDVEVTDDHVLASGLRRGSAGLGQVTCQPGHEFHLSFVFRGVSFLGFPGVVFRDGALGEVEGGHTDGNPGQIHFHVAALAGEGSQVAVAHPLHLRLAGCAVGRDDHRGAVEGGDSFRRITGQDRHAVATR